MRRFLLLGGSDTVPLKRRSCCRILGLTFPEAGGLDPG
jgi:hypothetical protein